MKTRVADARPRLYRVAYAWCHDAGLADDLAQEAVIKGLKSVHQLKDESVLEAWLFRILHNCWRDHFRLQHPSDDIEHAMELPAPGKTPDEIRAESELIGRVRRAVAALPMGPRQVVSLVDLEELSYTEAAEALAIPIGTVMSRLHRARKQMQVKLIDTAVQMGIVDERAEVAVEAAPEPISLAAYRKSREVAG